MHTLYLIAIVAEAMSGALMGMRRGMDRFGLALVGGTVLASLAAYVQWRPLKILLSRLPSAGVAFPGFWVGLLLIQFFAFTLHLLPSTGSATPASLILPAVTMAIPTSAMLAQVLPGLSRQPEARSRPVCLSGQLRIGDGSPVRLRTRTRLRPRRRRGAAARRRTAGGSRRHRRRARTGWPWRCGGGRIRRPGGRRP